MKTTIPPRRPGGALLVSALAVTAFVAGCNTCYHCPEPCPYGYDTSVPLYDRIVFGWLPDCLTLRSHCDSAPVEPVHYRLPPQPAEAAPMAEPYAPDHYAPMPEDSLEAEPMPAPAPEMPEY